MRALDALLIWAVVQAIPCLTLAILPSDCAYPSGFDDGWGSCDGVADAPLGREAYQIWRNI